jgi:hypothetical protein
LQSVPHFPQIPGFFPARKLKIPKIFRTIAQKPGKPPGFPHSSDGTHDPTQIPSRPIETGTLALKFFPPGFFWLESSRAEKFSARNFKILKIFRSKVENSKKIWRESWKKWCQLDN